MIKMVLLSSLGNPKIALLQRPIFETFITRVYIIKMRMRNQKYQISY